MNNFNNLINSNIPVLVDFYADWCAPCRMMAPILKQLKSEMGDKIKVIKINVDNNAGISAAYNIMSIPALMLFKNNELKWSGLGIRQTDELKNIIIANS